MAQLAFDDRALPAGLGLVIGVLPLAPATPAEERARWVDPVGGGLDHPGQGDPRPGLLLAGDLPFDQFAREGAGHEMGLAVHPGDGLAPVGDVTGS